MVIGDNDLATQFARPFYTVVGTDAGVYCDQHVRWIARQCFHQPDTEPVTELEAVGNTKIHPGRGHQVQGPHGERRTGRSIGIEIPYDQYALPGNHRISEYFCGLLDSGECRWLLQPAQLQIKRCLIGDTARQQNAADDRMQRIRQCM